MKSVAILALFGAVYAQDINSVPECGRTCIQNMLAEQANLGCPPADGQPNPSCLCTNADFSFGLRDCAQQACGSDVAESVVSYGVAYCQSAGVNIPTTVISGTPSATGSASGSATESGSASGSATESSSAITTSSFETTITSGDSTITTSAATTIFGVGGVGASASASASSAASEASESASSVGESASSAASSVASSASGAVSSATGAVGSAASSAAGEATSSSSEGFAPQMTAAPAAGFLAAAGIAAMLL